MGFILSDRSQGDLLGYRIDDFAKTDKKSRFVVDLVSQLKLQELFTRYSDQGGDAYSPDMMLALWFYAYSNGITSTRELEELCKYDTRYIYISANQQPDHTTLSRFRKSHLDLLSEYFLQIILIARQEGISAFNHIVIDGTKIGASRSASHSYNEGQLDQLITHIRQDIDRYMNQCNYVEQNITDQLDLETLRSEKARLESLEQKLLERKQLLNKRQKELKVEYRAKHRISLLEPEARFMPKADGLNYNAQTAVDTESKMIVAAKVTDQPNDQGQFAGLQQQVEETLNPDPKRAYTADAGYHNSEELQRIEQNNIDALIADPAPQNRSIKSEPTSAETILSEKRKIERSDFTYNKQDDYYLCPAADQLTKVKDKGKSLVYRARKCPVCPLARYCLASKKNYKQIQRSKREAYAERMAVKLQSITAKQRMYERWVSNEPVFGNLKHNLGFRRFALYGLKQVNGEFTLMAIAHNINILFKRISKHPVSVAIIKSYSDLGQHITMSKNILVKFYINFTNLIKRLSGIIPDLKILPSATPSRIREGLGVSNNRMTRIKFRSRSMSGMTDMLVTIVVSFLRKQESS
jgi:transposase